MTLCVTFCGVSCCVCEWGGAKYYVGVARYGNKSFDQWQSVGFLYSQKCGVSGKMLGCDIGSVTV